MTIRHSVIAAILAVTGVAAQAAPAAPAPPLMPGLWQTTSKVDFGQSELGKAMAMMQQQMATLSPEQRQAMQAMMSKHGAGQLPPMHMTGDGSVAMTVCITREMIDKSLVPMPTQGNCTQTSTPIVGGAMKTTFACTNPPSSGEARFQFTGGKAYSMTMNTTSTVNGQPQALAVDGSGRWIGADCGGVKPMTALMPR